MQLIPSIKGESISALKDGITGYETPSITQPKFSDSKSYKNDGLIWAKGQTIGEYSGEKQVLGNNTWYKVNFTVYRKYRLPILGLGYKYAIRKINGGYSPLLTNAWFQGSDVSAGDISTTNDDSQAAKDKKAAEQNKLLEDALNGSGNDTPKSSKGLFASIFGPTVAEDGTVTNNNLGAIVGVIVILIISIVGLVFLKKKQAKAAQPQMFSPNTERSRSVGQGAKRSISNPQNLK